MSLWREGALLRVPGNLNIPRALQELGRAAPLGLLVAVGWVSKPGRWERVKEGMRLWGRVAPGRGAWQGGWMP